mmetsp:Transcript_67142/g.194118  ORF Transcript_67142/g.194118 Transcript_67142/m.194118 type:complete len:235 (+) Transcript_67142:386-1090(+)
MFPQVRGPERDPEACASGQGQREALGRRHRRRGWRGAHLEVAAACREEGGHFRSRPDSGVERRERHATSGLHRASRRPFGGREEGLSRHLSARPRDGRIEVGALRPHGGCDLLYDVLRRQIGKRRHGRRGAALAQECLARQGRAEHRLRPPACHRRCRRSRAPRRQGQWQSRALGLGGAAAHDAGGDRRLEHGALRAHASGGEERVRRHMFAGARAACGELDLVGLVHFVGRFR